MRLTSSGQEQEVKYHCCVGVAGKADCFSGATCMYDMGTSGIMFKHAFDDQTFNTEDVDATNTSWKGLECQADTIRQENEVEKTNEQVVEFETQDFLLLGLVLRCLFNSLSCSVSLF